MALFTVCLSSAREAPPGTSAELSAGCTSKATSKLVVSFLLFRDLYLSTLLFLTSVIIQLASLPFRGSYEVGCFQMRANASCTTSSASHLSFKILIDSENNWPPSESYKSASAFASPEEIPSQILCSSAVKG